ncbi:NADPH-dependent FMN reductase [Actinoallomurus sp. CA-150999]|uniref:NADPH-dependent FMN reductase n=1 Tax=Actinoallomurus sp. CA-150999 TaxID=3239887 RepID=UPI003D9053C2
MPNVVVISGSPSPTSLTGGVLQTIGERLVRDGHDVSLLRVRDLPAAALLAGDTGDPVLGPALSLVAAADGVVVGTPVYKAAYSGLLKVLLDMLPQRGLAGKAVLPVATGGSQAHVLALDYALRPVLVSLGAEYVAKGVFLHSDHATRTPGGGLIIDPEAEVFLDRATDQFGRALRATVTDPA